MLNKQSTQDTIQPLTLLLELLPEKPEESDPAFIHLIGRDTVEALQHDGVTVQPVYTGQQGGDFIVELLTTVGQLATTTWDHRAVIEEVLSDSSALATLSSFTFGVIKHVKHAYEQRVGHEESLAHPLKITLELNGVSATTEISNLAQVPDVTTALVQLSKKAHSHSPASSHKLKIQPKIPKKRTRRKK